MSMKVASIVIVFALLEVSYCEFKPLELDHPVTIYYQTGQVYLNYRLSSGSPADVLFCFVQARRTDYKQQLKTDGTYFSECTLDDNALTFLCIRLFKNSNNALVHEYYEKDIDITKIWLADKLVTSTKSTTNNNSYKTPLNANLSITLQSQTSSQIFMINNYFVQKSFYHMITCPTWNNATGLCTVRWKQNYVQTFQHPEKRMNLIVQRIHHCGKYRKGSLSIFTHVFYGGVLRNNENYLFSAILTYTSDYSQSLNMWGGFAYSCDHANRDLFCYDTDGNAFDGVSLILGPVYKDTFSNIGGTDDTEIVDNFYSERYTNYYMYFIQFQRPYTTSNNQGDEVLEKKIYGKFCYVAHFEQVSSGQSIIIAPSCLSKNYTHNFMLRFRSDLNIFQPLLTILACFLLLVFL